MKAIKIFCEECDTTTYSVIGSHPLVELVICSNCGWAICCDEKDVVNIEEILDISNLVNKVGD